MNNWNITNPKSKKRAITMPPSKRVREENAALLVDVDVPVLVDVDVPLADVDGNDKDTLGD